MPDLNINPVAALNFITTRGRNAAATAGIRSRAETAQRIAEQLRLAPQDLSNVANRLSIQTQAGKSIQSRFFDLFV